MTEINNRKVASHKIDMDEQARAKKFAEKSDIPIAYYYETALKKYNDENDKIPPAALEHTSVKLRQLIDGMALSEQKYSESKKIISDLRKELEESKKASNVWKKAYEKLNKSQFEAI